MVDAIHRHCDDFGTSVLVFHEIYCKILRSSSVAGKHGIHGIIKKSGGTYPSESLESTKTEMFCEVSGKMFCPRFWYISPLADRLSDEGVFIGVEC